MKTKDAGCVVQPYLFFDGRCEEALEFYRQALGAEVTALMRYKESPEPAPRSPAARERELDAGSTRRSRPRLNSKRLTGWCPKQQQVAASLSLG